MEPFFKRVPQKLLFTKSAAVWVDLLVVVGMVGGPPPLLSPQKVQEGSGENSFKTAPTAALTQGPVVKVSSSSKSRKSEFIPVAPGNPAERGRVGGQ